MNPWLRGFSFERDWIVALFETVIPSDADPRVPLGADQAPMRRFVDDLLDHAPLQFIAGFRACVWLTQLAPPFVLARPRTFLGLGRSERLLLLERFHASPIYLLRELPLLLKTIGCLGFCGLPAVQAQLGITPRDALPAHWARALPLAGSGDEP